MGHFLTAHITLFTKILDLVSILTSEVAYKCTASFFLEVSEDLFQLKIGSKINPLVFEAFDTKILLEFLPCPWLNIKSVTIYGFT